MSCNPIFVRSRERALALAGTMLLLFSLAEVVGAPAGEGKGAGTLTATNAFTTNGISAGDAAKLKPFKLPQRADLAPRQPPAQAEPRENRKSLPPPMSEARRVELRQQIEAHYAQTERENPPVLREAQVVERGPHHNHWETYRLMTNETSRAEVRTNSYVELGMGLNRSEGGVLVPSRAIVELHPQGAIGRQGAHRVIFGPNINRARAIEVETSDGKVLKSHVLGLFYFDLATGKSVRISGLKDSEGAVHPPNKVVYQDAFADIRADLRYTYKLNGFEQDVILREQPPAPDDLGLNAETSQLVVLTEFVDAPEPRREARVLKKRQIQGRDVDTLTDETLDFGRMMMGVGRAFRLEQQPGQQPNKAVEQVPVGKRWLRQGGRTFLIEAVEYPDIKPLLPQLPKRAQLFERKPLLELNEMLVDFASPADAKPEGKRKMQVASLPLRGAGLVVDYDLVYSTNDFTFEGGKTYYVTGQVDLTGTTTIEGGAVIKYAPGAPSSSQSLMIYGTLALKTSDFLPAVFTARDDNTVGETISGSTGVPTGNYAYVALYFPWASTDPRMFENLRFSYAFFSIYAPYSGPVTVRNVQVLNGYCGPYVGNVGAKIQNCLIANTTYGVVGENSADVEVTHCTFSAVTNAFWASGTGTIRLTNSTFRSVISYGSYPDITGDRNGTYDSPAGLPGTVYQAPANPFQTVGGGDFYLASGSTWQNAGTADLDPELAALIARKTTEPPAIVSTGLVGRVVFSKRVLRDTDAPDLGYHYAPLDYVFAATWMQDGASVVVQPGTCIGVANPYTNYAFYGLYLNPSTNNSFQSIGLPTDPNRFVLFNAVQERGAPDWNQNIVGLFYGVSYPFWGEMLFNEFIVPGSQTIGTLYATSISAPGTLSIKHSSFRGGNLHMGGIAVTLNSCLLERTKVDGYSSGVNTFRNCTFVGGSASLATSFFGGSIIAQDNLFAKTTLTSSGNVTHGYNGYVTNYSRLSPAQTTDVVVPDIAFELGPLGAYYLASGGGFSDMGSQNAAAAGLYHFTTATDQAKDASSTVDLGFHYVALDGNGLFVDSDGDGLPDFFEDSNGNGQWNAGETDFQNAYTYQAGLLDAWLDYDYDGASAMQEYWAGSDPFDAGDFVLEPRLLARWRFDSSELVGDQGQMPRYAINASTVSSWNTNAVELSGSNVLTRLLNIDYGASTDTNFYKWGMSAYGLTTEDYWYPYYNPWVTDVTVTNLLWSDQTPLSPGASLRVQNAPGQWGSETGDYMYNGYVYDWNGAGIASTYNGLPPGRYDLYLYGHGAWYDQNTIFHAFTAARDFGSKNTIVSSSWASTNWTENLQYVKFTAAPLIEGQALQINGAHLAAWYFGINGMQLANRVASQLTYREVETNGVQNIYLKRGTIMFWVKPDWTSGTGPGHEGRLIEVGDQGTTNGWWALYCTSNGSQLKFSAQAGGITTNYLTCPIQWSNVWTHVALTYNETGSALYLNGILATNGWGVSLMPDAATRAMSGLNIGGDATGWNNIRGQMDELETYSYPLAGAAIQGIYNEMASRDSDGDHLTDRFEQQYQFDHLTWNDPYADTDYDGRSDWQEQADGTDPLNPLSVLPVQLGRWRFNTSELLGEQGQVPTSMFNVGTVSNWSGTALSHTNAAAGRLAYAAVETNGRRTSTVVRARFASGSDPTGAAPRSAVRGREATAG